MATVFIQKRERQNGNSYIIYYKDPATLKSKYYKTFRKKHEANQAAHDLRALIDNGKIIKIKENKNRIHTLNLKEVSEYQEREWNRRLENGELRKKTVEEYIHIINQLKRELGQRRMFEISGNDILKYRDSMASKFSKVTANRKLFVIKQIFKKAIELNAIFSNPVKKIKYLSEKEHERNRFLMPVELNRLIEASKKTRAKYYLPALIYLGAEHGASKQEALSLEWSDIDFNFGESGIIRFYRTKNKRERTEYIMPRTKQALIEWRDHVKEKREKGNIKDIVSDYVFCRINGQRIARFDSAWRNACDIAKILGFHFHDLRHTFCSNLLLAGSDLKDVKEMIGHNDLSMTDRYSHLTIQYKKEQQIKLSEHYNK